MNRDILRNNTGLAISAMWLGTLLTGCGADGTGQTAGLSAGGQAVLNQLTLVDLIEGYRLFNGQPDPAGAFTAEFGGVLVGELADLPEFQALLDETGVSEDQAAQILGSLVAPGAQGAVDLQSVLVGEISDAVFEQIVNTPQLAPIIEQTGVTPEQFELILLALVFPDQAIAAVLGDVIQQELANQALQQVAQIQGLQAMLDTAGISESDFDALVRDRVSSGDPLASLRNFAFLGGPFGRGARLEDAQALDLSAEQSEALSRIQSGLGGDIAGLRGSTRQRILDTLTLDQFDALQTLNLEDLGFFTNDSPPSRAADAGRVIERLAALLDLSDAQLADIEDSRLNLQEDAATTHAGARDRFKWLLDGDQLDLLGD